MFVLQINQNCSSAKNAKFADILKVNPFNHFSDC